MWIEFQRVRTDGTVGSAEHDTDILQLTIGGAFLQYTRGSWLLLYVVFWFGRRLGWSAAQALVCCSTKCEHFLSKEAPLSCSGHFN